MRLWQGASAFYDPELYQGVALNRTLGIAGFPNGEGSKAGDYATRIGMARLFVRQVIGFGGPTEAIDQETQPVTN